MRRATRSNTGEIVLDRDQGYVTLDTPRAHACAGRLQLHVTQCFRRGAALAVSLDGAPLIKSYGQTPWQVATAALEVTLRNDHVARLAVLDMNGMPLRTVPLARADGALRFAFPAEAMYVVLH